MDLDKQLCPKTTELVNKLFTFFYAICRGFDSQYGDNARRLSIEKNQWVMAFMDSGISEYSQIEAGIKKCRLDVNLINTPSIGQFIAWCKPSAEDLKLFSAAKAYDWAYKIMRKEDCSELSEDQLTIIQHAIHQSDPFFLKNNGRIATQPVFHRNYEIAVRDFLSGELKSIPKAIEHEETKEDSYKTINKYGGILPQYANLKGYEENMPVIMKRLEKNNGHIIKKVNKGDRC